jgi:hypothetical protein
LLSFKRDINSVSNLTANKTLVIEVEYGGLGDHLFYSHLPRLAKESRKYDAVYISNISPFRNNNHKEIIWGANPYVDGFFNGFGESHRSMSIKNKKLCNALISSKQETNVLDQIMMAFDLDDGKKFHNPELYYVPKKIVEYENMVIFDPNFITPLYDVTMIYGELDKFFDENKIYIDMQFTPRSERNSLTRCSKYVADKSFEEFCDIIFSCKELYCFASGTAVLAAALGRKANVFYMENMHPMFIFSKDHNYIKLS